MLKTQKRIAASILKVGEGRVWLDPEDAEAIGAAVTREDVKKLISERAIQVAQKKGISRYRAKKLHLQRTKGRRKGHGKRSGKKGARSPKKAKWISTIRPLRRKLVELRNSGKIDKTTYRKLYSLAKGGVFKNTSHLDMYLKELR